MAFIVQLSDLERGTSYTDEDVFRFMEHGVLQVKKGDMEVYYAPGYWQRVSTHNGHQPGSMKTKRPAGPSRIR